MCCKETQCVSLLYVPGTFSSNQSRLRSALEASLPQRHLIYTSDREDIQSNHNETWRRLHKLPLEYPHPSSPKDCGWSFRSVFVESEGNDFGETRGVIGLIAREGVSLSCLERGVLILSVWGAGHCLSNGTTEKEGIDQRGPHPCLVPPPRLLCPSLQVLTELSQWV